MNSCPRVSVVIPAFNAATTLSETLDSVIAQSFVDWEAVVVDDGSNDDTWEIAQHRSGDDPRIRVLSQENAGVSAARNIGIAAARAPLLVFLDSDDCLAPDHLACLLEAVKVEGAAVAYCGYLRVRSDGSVIAVEQCAEISERPFDVFARRSAAAIHCFMVRRDLVEEVGGFDTGLATCEDWDLWQRIARMGVRFTSIPSSLAYYRIRQGSLSGDRRQMLRDAIKVILRAQSRDPRVRAPDPQHVDGTKTSDAMGSVALFAVWCAAAEAAMGRDASNLLDEIPHFPDLRNRLGDVSTSIFSGIIAGGQLTPAEILPAWPTICVHLSALLDRIELACCDSAVAYQLRSALEWQVLRASTTSMGPRFDLPQPIPTILPPAGTDGICCRLRASDMLLTKIALLLFGAISATFLARAIAEVIVLRASLRHSGLIGRVRFWQALLAQSILAAPALSRAAALCLIKESAPLRALVREVLNKSVRTALVKPEKRLQEALSRDRRAFWEKTFETSDPWGYQSVYEQQKYAQTLSLLDGDFDRALELGCAEGIFTERLATKVGHLIAADISERALERARARCRSKENIEFRRVDFFDEPIPQGMDLIVCSEVLYYLRNKFQLARGAEKLASALARNGCLLTAHAFLLSDDRTRTGFDWDEPFGALAICEALQAAGLKLEKSIQTELYRIDLFRRIESGESAPPPSIARKPFGSPLEPEVEAGVVWGGAVLRRADIASAETIRVPVLLYHRITADAVPAPLSEYRVSPSAFEEQMQFLRSHGYHTINSSELERHRRERRPMNGRPVLITFDDGYRDFYEVAWPILRRFGFTAELFLPTDFIGGTADWDRALGTPAELMSWEEIAKAHS